MKYLFLIIAALLLCTCKGRQDSPVATIDVLSPVGTEIKNLSEIAADIRYIPLETNPDALMVFIRFLKISTDRFYINTVREILCFEKSGKFLYKLNPQGRGPGEYTYIADYDVKPEQNLMTVLTSGELYFYSETDTGFIVSKHLDLGTQPQYVDFLPEQDNILLSFTASTGENDYQCVAINHDGDTLFKRPNYYKFLRNSKVVMAFNFDNIIYKDNEEIKLKGFLNDTVFKINGNNSFVPYVILNTGGKSMTADFLSNVPPSVMTSGTGEFLQISEILEVERYLFCKYSYQQVTNWIVYEKNTGQLHQFNGKDLLKDDISGGINIEPKFVCNGIIYAWTDAMKLKSHLI